MNAAPTQRRPPPDRSTTADRRWVAAAIAAYLATLVVPPALAESAGGLTWVVVACSAYLLGYAGGRWTVLWLSLAALPALAFSHTAFEYHHDWRPIEWVPFASLTFALFVVASMLLGVNSRRSVLDT